jgi:hypothetical protein
LFRQACQAQIPSERLKMEVVATGGASTRPKFDSAFRKK